MFTLVFLLCMDNVCISSAPKEVFKTEEECSDMGWTLVEKGLKEIEAGSIPPHKAVFKCVSWGLPA